MRGAPCDDEELAKGQAHAVRPVALLVEEERSPPRRSADHVHDAGEESCKGHAALDEEHHLFEAPHDGRVDLLQARLDVVRQKLPASGLAIGGSLPLHHISRQSGDEFEVVFDEFDEILGDLDSGKLQGKRLTKRKVSTTFRFNEFRVPTSRGPGGSLWDGVR